MGANQEFTYAFSTVPAEILSGQDIITEAQQVQHQGQTWLIPGLGLTPVPVYLTMITSMFMHGSFAHLFGNMLYLWVFGDNLENRMGHLRYLIFYLLCGVLASLAHVFFTYLMGKDTMVPSLGASGAISAILGGYLVLFPRRQVRVWAFWFVFSVPAIITLGLWIVMQLVSGFGSLYGEGDGVAYAAHIGGFIAGMLLVKFFDAGILNPLKSKDSYYVTPTDPTQEEDPYNQKRY